jgi:hypothetical protein
MSEIGEALGTTVEGGLFARALSRRAGAQRTKTDGHFQESACLNCATPLIGTHCHACGQAAHLHRTLGALGHDLMHGVLHLDGKAWRTLPLLAWKPGELTRRYIHGERARFVSPMALFLFSIFLMFAVFQAIGISPPTDINTGEGLRSALIEARADTEEQLASRRAKLARMEADDPDRAEQEQRIAASESELAGLRQAETLRLGGDSVGSDASITGVSWIDQGIIDKWKKNPGLMLYKLQANSYKFSWLLIPLSLPFMWLLFFWKRGVRVYDHAIFVTYSIAFMSLLFVVLSVLGVLGVHEIVLVTGATAVPLIHLARHLKGTYGLSRRSAAWRLAVLVMLMIPIVVALFLQVLLVLGAF